MRPRLSIVIVLVLFLAGLTPVRPVQADGIIIPCVEWNKCPPPPCTETRCPPPPHPIPLAQLAIRYHHVTVKIENQVAVTHVDQVFYNPNKYQIEGTYAFPLPMGAAVTNFTLWVDGKPTQGEVLSADQARQRYEEIVNSLRDPALLEYVGRGVVMARIFPIAPDGERRIELEYTQALAAENGLVRYQYPLGTEKYSTQPLEDVSVTVSVTSAETIYTAYSLSHAVEVNRQDDHHLTAGYEAKNVTPDADFSLYYTVGQSQPFHLLTYRDANDPLDPDGFFLLMLAPTPEKQPEVLPKDVLIVLDRSGSMEGEKVRQAQSAARFILGHLNENDRFNVISFSSAVESFAPAMRTAAEAAQAQAWVDRLGARGSTDINQALLTAAGMLDQERPGYLIFLTDGLPTQGVIDVPQILTNFAAAAPKSLRLFTFGVGYDVDTALLDTLAQDHHGTSTYVEPGQPLDEILSTFYARISTPLLTDLSLDFGGLAAYDLYPQPLPDLFEGSQVLVVGRYKQGGTYDLVLNGKNAAGEQSFRSAGQVFASDNAGESAALAALPRLWATRKIGYLLNLIRLKGPDQETIDQIVRLSIRYGIVTPYTSYLVSEPSALGAENQERISREAYDQAQSEAAAPSSGRTAVQKAAGQGEITRADVPEALPQDAAAKVRLSGGHTFVNQNEVWTDTLYDSKTMQVIKVAFLSKDYFALAVSDPALAAALALGEQVIVVRNHTAYQVVGASEQSAALVIATASPVPGQGQPTATQPPAVQLPTAAPRPPEKNQASNPLCPGALLPLAAGLMLLSWQWFRRK